MSQALSLSIIRQYLLRGSDQMKRSRGFTIVELLIVIVVIGILAAITIVAYNGVQNRARNAKISSDLGQLQQAIIMARTAYNENLYRLTGNAWTGGPCLNKPSGTNLATLVGTGDPCWTQYVSTLDKISVASGVNVRNLLDPWGRPYYIDENEEAGGVCHRDKIAAFSLPFVTASESSTKGNVLIPLYNTAC